VVNKFNFLDLYYFYFQTAGIHTSNRVATHFQKKFSILFQYVFHTKFKRLQYHHLASFFKNFTRGTQETSAEMSSAVKKKILINKWLNLEFPYFFNTLCAFWPNSILFQGLENRFHNSILFQYRVETLPRFPHIFENHFPYLFNTFSILIEIHSIPPLIFIFPKFDSRNTTQKSSAKLSSEIKNKIWINKWLNL